MSKNIVFVLGAGFSKAAGLPLQRELLPEIVAFDGGDLYFKNAQNIVKTFISENFPGVNVKHLTLEDLFTILDKAVLGKEYFGGYRWQTLYSIRKSLVHALLVLIDARMKFNIQSRSLYNGIAQFVIDCGLVSDQYNVGVISLNWDTLFGSVINEFDNQQSGKSIDINYCVFGHSLDTSGIEYASSPQTPTAVKIMKLHGSINWLYCPNCGRLYINRHQNIGIQYKTVCPNCPANKEEGIILEEMIITPTMLKEFQNHHLRLTWQHAFMELNRADIVIFIGYSFPLADFELRYFFKKALTKDVSLSAVLHSSDKKNGTKDRYENFFGSSIQFCFKGFENWWEESPFKKG